MAETHQQLGPVEKRLAAYLRQMLLQQLPMEVDRSKLNKKITTLVISLSRHASLKETARNLEILLDRVNAARKRSEIKDELKKMSAVLKLAPKGVSDAVGEMDAKPIQYIITEVEAEIEAIMADFDNHKMSEFQGTVVLELTVGGKLNRKILQAACTNMRFGKISPMTPADAEL